MPHQLRSETKIRFSPLSLARACRPAGGAALGRRRLPPLELAFLAIAIAIVGLAMVSAGRLVSAQMAASITSGIADTTAASMDVMLSDELVETGPQRPLPNDALAGLNALFSAANDTGVNELMQIRLRNPDGSLLYESLSGLIDREPSDAELATARQGRLFSQLVELPLVAVGPGTAGTLPVLKLIIPVHDRASGAVEATAELYFGASSLVQLQKDSEWRVWTIIGVIGAMAVLALFALIHRTSGIIDTQQHRLAESLAASQTLAAENAQLRRQAVVANERLLAQVGADLHDGPLQLLAAHILALSRPKRPSAAPAELAAARQAIEELRNISAGLVLPELSGLSLQETIGLAVRRHEEMTGAPVHVRFGTLPADAPLDLKVCLYRIAQEGLGNAARHGVSGSTAIAIGFADGRVMIEITNGISATGAVAPAAQPARARLGLAGMRARLEAVGGQLTFERGEAMARLVAYAPL